MPNSTPYTGRWLDDEELPPPDARLLPSSGASWTRRGVSRAPPPLTTASATSNRPPPLRPSQRACYDALGLALKEGHVFAALTGPPGCGKTTVLDAVIADLRDRSLRCIRIGDPDKVPAKLAAQIEQVAYAEAAKTENLDRHIVLAVDDAHLGSDELMGCLTRLAAINEPGRRVPQVLLVGAPGLWDRLAAEQYEPLDRRLAIRAVLPPAEGDDDPWASVEQEVTQTLAQPRGADEALPFVPASLGFEWTQPRNRPNPDPVRAQIGDASAPPPSMYALFPDLPRAAEPAQEESPRRVWLPLGVLFVSVAACALVLSFYDWPDVFDDLPWADKKPAAQFVIPPSVLPSSPRAQSPVIPQSPAWAQSGQHPPSATPPPAPPQAAAPLKAPAPEQPVAVAASPPNIETPQASPPTAPPPATATARPAPPAVAEPQPAPAAARENRPAAAPPAAQAAPVASHIITLLLRRGDEQFAIGDVSAARLLYRRAAEAGSAQGARLEARTYDQAFLPPADASTLADRDAARLWYARAAALGDAEAATRLKTLNQGR